LTYDLNAVLESKRKLRLRLASLPIAEKLRMLDELREREVTIRRSALARNGSDLSDPRLKPWDSEGVRHVVERDG
jgi:hypothetical protein